MTQPNRLIDASSPYLLQHAHNPVDWWEWCDEAFEKARREDKMVLVSIGYSACHWCHVMEHESFEDIETANLMNTHFVCIKVDREERPDVDQLYMDAIQLLTGRGGWPLNCFVLPDGRPVHGGTYFPKTEWQKLLKSLADFYVNKREEAMQYATDLTLGIRKLDVFPKSDSPSIINEEQITANINQLKSQFDIELGGFAWAPKFPMPNSWELILHQYCYTKDDMLLKAVNQTLTKMAEGGIYDQVGGGFSRYSTDVYWKVPHFEKMLYDNAQLVSLYSYAFLETKNDLFEKIVRQTLNYIQREMTSIDGLFYSAQDADSEGVEGKFYCWTHKDLKNILGTDEPVYSLYHSVDVYGNWEHGQNILYKTRTDQELQELTGLHMDEINAIIQRGHDKLMQARDKRIRPGLDDKIITSWNALMIKAYCDAYLVFGNQSYLESAKRAADYILNHQWQKPNLMRILKNDKISIPAFAEDYALLCEALLKLYEASNMEQYAIHAYEIMQSAVEQFFDVEKSLFYFKSKNDVQLVSRKIDVNDDVIPGANSTFAKCLFVLGYLFDEPKYHQMVEEMVLRIQSKIEKYPMGFSNWMQLVLIKSKGFQQLIVSGSNAERPKFDKLYPNLICLIKKSETQIPLLKDKPVTLHNTYYLCIDKTCGLPQTQLIHPD
jgi:uncharacterized protein YyaL (SSP411 family)